MIIEITYYVQFTAKIEVPDNATPAQMEDALNDVDIPEGGKHHSIYKVDTFAIMEASYVNRDGVKVYLGD